MSYLLDTNICIYIIKQKPLDVINKFKSCSPGELGISSITLAELNYGIAKSRYKTQNQIALKQFLTPLDIYSFNDLAAEAYGNIRAGLETQGKLIGAMDLLIAGHALCLDLTLISNNIKEFERVKGLRVENWANEAQHVS